METYDQLTDRMYQTFEKMAGYSPDNASDLGIRMKVLAGEIYSTMSSLEYLKKQLSLATATGEELTALAEEHGLVRKPAQKAQGILEFKIEESLWFNVLIPKGTVCTTQDGTVNFITTEEATIDNGNLYTLVPAEAEQAGQIGNARTDTITVLVSQPVGAQQVTNPEAFWGGADEESDEHLRQRLLTLLRDPPRSVNAAFYREICLKNPEVSSVAVGGTADRVMLYLAGQGKAPSEQVVQQVNEMIQKEAPVGVTVIVQAVTLKKIPISAELTSVPGYKTEETKTFCEEQTQAFFHTLGAGENFYMAQLAAALLATGKIKNCTFLSSTKDTVIAENQLCVYGDLNFTWKEGEEI